MIDTDIQDYHEPTREEIAALNDVTPLTQGKVEPMLLLDLSGSMVMEGASADDNSPRKIDVVLEALPTIVEALEGEDSEHEENPEEEDEGGIYTIGFSDQIFDFKDLNSKNVASKRAEIRSRAGGGTVIVGGWNAIAGHYDDEFGDRPIQDQPRLAGLIITDGAAEDGDLFAELLAKQGKRTYIVVAVIGHGKAYERTVKQYTDIAKNNSHVRLLTFDSVTNPLIIARSLLALIGK